VQTYTYIMGRRTQITLTDAQHEFLYGEAHRTGLSMAELVRRAVDETYRPELRPRVRGFDLAVGWWRNPDAAVAGRRAGAR
jgi:hypothetical protein